MSSEGPISTNADGNGRHRRGSITQAALTNLFQRSGSISNAPGFPPNGTVNDAQRRRLSVNTLGLSGSVPSNTPSFGARRGSISTNSDSIDENAIEDDETAPSGTRTAPLTPFVRRMSYGGSAIRSYRPGGGSPGNDQQGFNWSDQLRSRAESSVTGSRPSFSFASTSPPRTSINHDRAKSISDMPQPPVQAATAKPKQERPKPDAFQERILKGDFYMD